jgi:hypothetical protein
MLRHRPCDALLALHQPPTLDALMLARALRGAGDETPLAILGAARSIDLEAAAWDAGADEYACLAETTAEQLAGRLRRAIAARQRLRETRRALVAEQRQLARDEEEARRAVSTQRRLVEELRRLPDEPDTVTVPFASQGQGAAEAYTQRVRSALVAGAPRSDELGRLADSLAAEGTSGPRLLEIHLRAVEGVVEGLEPRAAQAVREEADRLLFEAVVHLAEAYRRRYLRTVPVQETPAARAA